ncbi:MAG TPA: hypothetical protein VFR48_01415 [Solirubrobacteraceae bacterium]|nr:hypothetical protein [Solirubrobacteraceae bacterium]
MAHKDSSTAIVFSPVRVKTLSAAVALAAVVLKSRGVTGAAPAVVRFTERDYHLDIYNPESSAAFALAGTTVHAVTATPDSSRIESSSPAGFAFVSHEDELRWRNSGQPTLPKASRKPMVAVIASGAFNFMPQGSRLTYEEVRRLPASPSMIEMIVIAHAHGYTQTPEGAALLKQYGVLLATAPLSSKVRAAMFDVVARLPGLRVCAAPSTSSNLISVCLAGGGNEVDLTISLRTGAVRSVREYLIAPAGYADLQSGTLLEAETFSHG